jgi:hypothetical protein
MDAHPAGSLLSFLAVVPILAVGAAVDIRCRRSAHCRVGPSCAEQRVMRLVRNGAKTKTSG